MKIFLIPTTKLESKRTVKKVVAISTAGIFTKALCQSIRH